MEIDLMRESQREWIIWGLKNERNSFRYIWDGFYTTLRNLGQKVYWLEDDTRNAKYVSKNSIVLVVGISIRHLPTNAYAKYILHNVEDERFYQQNNFINLQVWHKGATGVKLDDSIAMYDHTSKTLYQPWGISEIPELWRSPRTSTGNKEFWIGSVWNNHLNQGNESVIREYRAVLSERKIKFKRQGGTRSLKMNGIRPEVGLKLINESAYGAAIVGNWQADIGYIPCRLFKNVAAGKIPISNANFANIFQDLGIFDSNLGLLLDRVDELTSYEYLRVQQESQQLIQKYSYTRNLSRIISQLMLRD